MRNRLKVEKGILRPLDIVVDSPEWQEFLKESRSFLYITESGERVSFGLNSRCYWECKFYYDKQVFVSHIGNDGQMNETNMKAKASELIDKGKREY